ncbi:MAG: hypothetical protein EA343_18345 [Nodularia sp. (in: Bacteria)]|nr:MAG: hypothetical protein EA343_18345 [Nodularia sp. (in: cyanobacteria)]
MKKVANGIWEIEKFLNAIDCKSILDKAYLCGFKIAKQQKRGRYNQETFIDYGEVALKLFFRLQKCISEYSKITTITSIGKVIECYRYEQGDYITAHYDKSTEIDHNSWSTHTLIIYLSDNVMGGETSFLKHNIIVVPELGKAVLFEHSILHQANEVLEGIKYVSRLNVGLMNYESL